jgi:hypothetical protein
MGPPVGPESGQTDEYYFINPPLREQIQHNAGRSAPATRNPATTSRWRRRFFTSARRDKSRNRRGSNFGAYGTVSGCRRTAIMAGLSKKASGNESSSWGDKLLDFLDLFELADLEGLCVFAVILALVFLIQLAWENWPTHPNTLG